MSGGWCMSRCFANRWMWVVGGVWWVLPGLDNQAHAVRKSPDRNITLGTDSHLLSTWSNTHTWTLSCHADRGVHACCLYVCACILFVCMCMHVVCFYVHACCLFLCACVVFLYVCVFADVHAKCVNMLVWCV